MQIASRQIAMPTYRSSTVFLAHTYGRDFACRTESRVCALLLPHRHAVMCARTMLTRGYVKPACSWVVPVQNLLRIRCSIPESCISKREFVGRCEHVARRVKLREAELFCLLEIRILQ